MQIFPAHQAKYAFMVHTVAPAAQFSSDSRASITRHLLANGADLPRYRFVPVQWLSHWWHGGPVVTRSRHPGQSAQPLHWELPGSLFDQIVHHGFVGPGLSFDKMFFACVKAFFKNSFSKASRPIIRSSSAMRCSSIREGSFWSSPRWNALAGSWRYSRDQA